MKDSRFESMGLVSLRRLAFKMTTWWVAYCGPDCFSCRDFHKWIPFKSISVPAAAFLHTDGSSWKCSGGRPLTAIGAPAPPLILLPHGSHWRAADGRLDAAALFQVTSSRPYAYPLLYLRTHVDTTVTYLSLCIRSYAFAIVIPWPEYIYRDIFNYLSDSMNTSILKIN